MCNYDGPAGFDLHMPGNSYPLRFPIAVNPLTGEPDISDTLQYVDQHLRHSLPPADRQVAVQRAENEVRRIVRHWQQSGKATMQDFFDVGLANEDLDQSMRLVQWHKIHQWLRSHEEWKQNAELDQLAGAVYDLSFDGDDMFLDLTIYADKNHLNSATNNKALLLRLAGQKYRDKPLGFPLIASLNISPGPLFSPEYLAVQSGLPSPDITLLDFAPDKPDCWI